MTEKSHDPNVLLNFSQHPDNDWPNIDTPTLVLGQFIGPIVCDSNRHAVLFEGALRLRCTAPRHDIPKGMVLFEYYSRETGKLIESRIGPYRRP